MNYQEAKKIREKSYISYLTEKLSEGQGLGAALKATSSDRSRAKAMGYKEKFDPLNIVKFMTGGSKFATALYGSMRGRTQQDIQYFTGTKKAKDVGATATKIDQLESNNEVIDVLSKIYGLLKTTNENDVLRKEKEENSKEERELERERRHKELIAAITGKKTTTAAPTAVKADEGGGILSIVTGMIAGAIGGVMSMISGIMSTISDITGFIKKLSSGLVGPIGKAGSVLFTLGKFLLTNPIGWAILAAAGIAYGVYKIANADPSEEAKAEAEGISQSDKVGGLPGVKDELDFRKKMPEYDKTMADIKDYQFVHNEGDPLNDTQLEGFKKRGSGAAKAVEDYKAKRDEVKEKLKQINQTATPVPPTIQNEPVEKPSTTEQSSVNNTASQVAAVPDKLNTVTSENLELNMPSTPESVISAQITNNMNVNSTNSQRPKGPIPSVRNVENSFQRMLLNSLRVV